MTEPFSLAAGSFAVVSLADVVLRAGKDFYQFLNAIKDAPTEVEALRYCIHDNTLLVEESKRYWEDLKDHASLTSSSTDILSRALPQFTSALRSLNRELSTLVALAKRYGGNSKSWGRIRWVLDERKIHKSLQKLEISKSTLVTALLLVGRRQDALCQKSIEHDMHQEFQTMTTNLVAPLQTLTQQMQEVRDGIAAREARSDVAACRFLGQAASPQKHIVSANRNALRQHDKTRQQIIQGNTKVIDTICSKFQDLLGNLAPTNMSTRKGGREVRVNRHSVEAILSPLLLLKPGLRWAITHTLSHHSQLVSATDLDWLKSEFENLLSSATQEVAAISKGSTATSFDNWIYSQDVTSSFSAEDVHERTYSAKKRPRYECELSFDTTGSEEIRRRKRPRINSQSFSFTLPVGKIGIVIPRPTGVSLNPSDSCNGHEVGFSFIPQSDICSTSIQGSFMKVSSVGPEPRLYARLNAFNIIEDQSLHRDLFYDGTLEEIDTAFRVGQISPYDLAVYFDRMDLLLYFSSHGIGQSSLNGRNGALDGLWVSLCSLECENDDAHSIFKVLAYLDNANVIDESFDSGHFLHANSWDSGPECSDEAITSFRRWMQFLKREEYDFEQNDMDGMTPLLDWLRRNGRQSLEMARLLLELGANVYATDFIEQNALQLAMFSSSTERYREILEQKLCLLIEAGADVNHCDNIGDTPSHDAQEHYDCWDEWCRALKSNSLDIHEVIHADEERRKASQEKERQESEGIAEAEQTAE